MTRLKRILKFLMTKIFLLMATLSVLLSTPAIARLSLQTVEAEGSGVTRQEATLDALQWAVGQVNGVEVAASVSSQMSEYMTEQNGSVSTTLSSSFSKNVDTATNGIVESYEVVAESVSDGLTYIQIRARIGVYDQSVQLKRLRMAVSDVIIDPEIGDFGSSAKFARDLRRAVTDYLTQTRRFAMIDRDFLASTQKELEFIASGNTPTIELARLGNKVGTDYLVLMTLNKLTNQQTSRIYKTARVQKTTKQFGVDVSIRIIDVATSQIKFAYTIAEVSHDDYGGLAKDAGFLSGQVISNAIFPARVVAVADGIITINQGGKTLKIGETYNLVKLGKPVNDPYTKESLGRVETKVGRVEISDVQAKTSSAKIIEINLSDTSPLAAGTFIIRPEFKTSDAISEARESVKKSQDRIKAQQDDFFD